MLQADIPLVMQIDSLSFPNPWSRNSYEYELNQNENSRCWVGYFSAMNNENICAFAVFWNIIDEVHIGTIAVHPEYRNSRIGSLFLGKLLSYAKNEGMLHALLEVRQSNDYALKMYESLGFHTDGMRKNYYRDNGENAILMSAPLLGNLSLDEMNSEEIES
jgi:ribosomal-protein-alanine N-acetyltransferase